MELLLGESERTAQSRSEQSSTGENVTGDDWWPINPTVTALRVATEQKFTESLSVLLNREVGDLNAVAEPSKELKCLITIDFTQYGLEDPSWRPSAHSSRCGSPSIMKCDVDIGKVLSSKVVLSSGVAMFQGLVSRWLKN